MSNKAKRMLSLLISVVFFAACYLITRLRRMAGQTVRGSAVVIYYHDIPSEQRSRFAHQMDTLLRWVKPLDASFRSPLNEGMRFAAVTFDDGFQSFLENALPELEKRKIPATLFMIAGKLGTYPEWPGYTPDPLHKDVLLTADQLRQIPSSLISVESHSLTHPTLTCVSENEAKQELRESRVQLEKLLGRRVTLFSFPQGAFNEKLVDWCREAGYERVFTILPELAFSDPFEYVTGRVRTDPTDWPLEFILKLLGAYRWLPLAFTLKRKMLSLFRVRKVAELEQKPG